MLRSCTGSFPPLFSIVGGIVAQEVLKAATGKFQPLSQFLYVDASELYESDSSSTENPENPLSACLGCGTVESLRQLRLFLVGCGAIGCELLKIFALLEIGTGDNGYVSVTDNDLIEKSNLNRQFLFRPHHVQQSKSEVAAKTIKSINPQMAICPFQVKVCKDTESDIFPDEFFCKHDAVVNALDSVEARMYVDSRCVSNCLPLFESGTLGTKGHVQVILPWLTECYSTQRDPPEQETPFCTLKSFPAKIEHTIQWARNKFESLFMVKPSEFNKFWAEHKNTKSVCRILCNGERPEGFRAAIQLLVNRPQNWTDCVCLARKKFEKYFSHKAMQLLVAFPEDYLCSDGTLFWQPPKRPPLPIDFDPENTMHLEFILSCAQLMAICYGIKHPSPSKEREKRFALLDDLNSIRVPGFRPKNKGSSSDHVINFSKLYLLVLFEFRAETQSIP